MGYTNDVWLHHAQLGQFQVGSTVTFTCFLSDKGLPQAKDLFDTSTGEPAAKRFKGAGAEGAGEADAFGGE